MPANKRDALQRYARRLPVTFLTFTPDLPAYMQTADLVVSMAGYNTTCEILSLQKRAVLIPRTQVRAEQRLRAVNLAARGLARLILPGDLTPARLWAEIESALDAPPPQVSLNLGGLQKAGVLVHPVAINKSR